MSSGYPHYMDPVRRSSELTPAEREAVARNLLQRVHQRAALSEGVGILQTWRLCGQKQVRADLFAEHGRTGQDTEARRVIAVVNAAADRRADPDAMWD